MRSKSYLSLIALVLSIGLFASSAHGQFTGVFTQHNDNGRTGQNLNETILTSQNVNVNKFGKIFSYPVDGQVYTQPLYVPNVSIPNLGVHNVVYIATENDSVYAFDADGLSPYLLWKVNFSNPAQGITTLNCISLGFECNVWPNTGITGTPVIDPTTNTMYLMARTQEPGNSSMQRLHALDITSGAEKFGGPVAISGTVKGTGSGSSHGQIPFSTLHDNHRPMLLANGNIYMAWAGQAHGWVMAYNATTLKQVAIFNTTPNGTLGGIWESGSGIAADSEGNLYLATGDGTFDASTGGTDYGDTLIKFDANLNVVDYFTPMDQACRLIPNDLDLGSGGPMVLPTQSGSFPDEIIESGKGGNPCDLWSDGTYASPIYLTNRDNMGKYDSSQDQVIEEIEGAVKGYWSNPAYWSGAAGNYLYYAGAQAWGGVGDYLKQYTVKNGIVSSAPVSQSSVVFPVSATPSISANGNTNGIVWAVARRDSLSSTPGLTPAVLYAFNATNVSQMLYSSTQNAQQRDQLGCGNKFQVPTVANGKVYVGTQNELDVFGVIQNQANPRPSITVPCFSITGQTIGKTSPIVKSTLRNLGPGTLNISSIAVTGPNAAEFAQTNNCGSALISGGSCVIEMTFTATVLLAPQVATIVISDNASGGGQTIALYGVAAKK
jgi:PQQ-like domain